MVWTTKQATKTIAVAFALNVPTETLESALLSGAITGPHGYGYWCSNVEALQDEGSRKRRLGAKSVGEWLLRGGSVQVTEYDESDPTETHHTLTREQFLKGFAQWVVEFGQIGERDSETGIVDFEIDAPSSDAILQFAVFGEQKYG